MDFLSMLRRVSPLSRLFMELGTRLCAAMLSAALLILVWADAADGRTALLLYYAQTMTALALVPLAAGHIGAALLEDILWSTT